MPTVIPVEGPDHPALQPYHYLTDPDRLQQAGLFVAEGRLVVERLATALADAVHSLLVTPSGLERIGPALAGLPAETPVYVAQRALMREVVGYRFHRGCLAVGRRPAPKPLESTVTPATRTVLFLETVTDPDNVGSIFRTARALAGDAILLNARSADPFYRKAIRTSMGTVFELPWSRCPDARAAVAALQDQGWLVAALTPTRDARPLESLAVQADTPLVLLAGSEATGLSRELLALATVQVTIPMRSGADSLNVAVAVAIALASLRR